VAVVSGKVRAAFGVDLHNQDHLRTTSLQKKGIQGSADVDLTEKEVTAAA
jgi:hypothetical protein